MGGTTHSEVLARAENYDDDDGDDEDDGHHGNHDLPRPARR